MANTIIQIKRSVANAVPSALQSSELGYSFNSGKLFIGNTDGIAVFAIGGRYFVDQQNVIFNSTNAAFLAANSAFAAVNASPGSVSYGQANIARDTANVAFNTANGAYGTANLAYNTANTKFNSSGGTISGTVTITGDLIVTGNQVLTSTSSMNIGDPLIYLAANNGTTDAVDIGYVGQYNSGAVTLRTGVYRDATTKEYYIFDGYNQDPSLSNHIDPTANGFSLSVLNASIRTSNLNLGGVNAISWIIAVSTAGNAAFGAANAAFSAANSAFANANATHTFAVSVSQTANAASVRANGSAQVTFATIVANGNNITATTNNDTLRIIAGTNIGITTNSANNGIVISDLASGSAFGTANAAFSAANSGFGAANASFLAANSAFNRANGSSDAANLTSGTILSARLSGAYGGITGVGLVVSGTWNANTITVPFGGTGKVSFTTNGVLFGNATGDLKVTGAGSEGHVLQADATGVPTFAGLDGGTF